MRNITQQEVDAIQKNNAPIPEKVMFAIVGMFSGNQALYHAVPSANAHYFLQEDQFLAESADGKEVSVIHINSIRVPMKKPQVEQKKRKKYKRPCNGVDYLEKIPFDYSKVKVGDKVELRNGNIATVDLLDDTTQPIHLKDGLWYKPNGGVNFMANGYTDPEDIIYILRKTKKSVPKTEQKKDEFRFVNSSTGQEIVFSRDELQLIKEIIGKVAERRDALDNNYFGNKHRRTMHGICDMLYYAGFCENYKFTNDIVLRPDTPTLIFKE